MILAEKIILLRKKNEWSQEELAEQLGISRQSVSKWESGASIPDLDKIIRMSELFDVSTDYLLKDSLEEEQPSETENSDGEIRMIDVEEANLFLKESREFAGKIANVVFLFILSPVVLLLLGVLSEQRNMVPQWLTEDFAVGIGMVVLLILVTIGVAVCIFTGIGYSKYDYLDKEAIELKYGVDGIVRKKSSEFEECYKKNMAFGVVLIIVGLLPLFFAIAMKAGDLGIIITVDVLLLAIAVGVHQLIWAGVIQESFNKLLQVGDFSKESKVLRKKTEIFTGIYWCLMTAIYLGISFYWMNWDRSWIIWPVAGVFYVVFFGVLRLIFEKKGNQE